MVSAARRVLFFVYVYVVIRMMFYTWWRKKKKVSLYSSFFFFFAWCVKSKTVLFTRFTYKTSGQVALGPIFKHIPGSVWKKKFFLFISKKKIKIIIRRIITSDDYWDITGRRYRIFNLTLCCVFYSWWEKKVTLFFGGMIIFFANSLGSRQFFF